MCTASAMKDLFLQFIGGSIRWFGRMRGYHRLEKVRMVPLRAPLLEAIALYGEPVETKVHEDFPEATEYIFNVSPYHDAVIFVWRGVMHTVVYWSSHADPGRDLVSMLTHFGEGHTWEDLTSGYSYIRADREVRLWCSAVPAIGVGTREYQQAQAAYRESQKELAPLAPETGTATPWGLVILPPVGGT